MIWFDRLCASRIERSEALRRGRMAAQRYGADAAAMLREQLSDPRRATSKRVIRLAIAELRRNRRLLSSD